MSLETLNVIRIVVTVVNTIVRIIGIVVTLVCTKKEHQKSNRPDQS